MESETPDRSPSTYGTAPNSAVETDSPTGFWTPPGGETREESSTSDASKSRIVGGQPASAAATDPTSGHLLEQHSIKGYISASFAVRASSDLAEMPPLTRLQERLQTASSPINDDSPPRARARSLSPVTRENMLREVSPHSSSYIKKVQLAVDEVTQSLMQRGRIQEGNAMQELYNQSFKDPGSKELLDSLLRNRASNRQTMDFRRYVEDVNRLQMSSPTVIARHGSPRSSTRSKRPSRGAERETTPGRETGAENVSLKDERTAAPSTVPTSASVGLDFNQAPQPRVGDKFTDLRPSAASPAPEELLKQPPSSALNESSSQNLKKKGARRGRRGQGSRRKFVKFCEANMFPEQGSRKPEQPKLSRYAEETGMTRSDAMPMRGRPRTHGVDASRGATSAPEHWRKSRKNKLFRGADGPVYTGNTLGMA